MRRTRNERLRSIPYLFLVFFSVRINSLCCLSLLNYINGKICPISPIIFVDKSIDWKKVFVSLRVCFTNILRCFPKSFVVLPMFFFIVIRRLANKSIRSFNERRNRHWSKISSLSLGRSSLFPRRSIDPRSTI